jgi:hypothetical protein
LGVEQQKGSVAVFGGLGRRQGWVMGESMVWEVFSFAKKLHLVSLLITVVVPASLNPKWLRKKCKICITNL